MENFEENRQQRVVSDVEETIFVAVGKNVEKNKTTVFWALQNFAGKKISLLHVHKPSHVFAFKESKCAVNGLKQHADKIQVFDQYLLLLSQAGVQGDSVWIEKDNVEDGIVEVITQQNIRWLVMGAAADKHYSKKLLELKSKKAIFVCQQAPISCHMWFCCKGCLIYTRSGSENRSELEISPTFLLMNSNEEMKQSGHLKLESLGYRLGFPDVEEDADDELEETSCCSVQSSWSSNSLLGTSKSTPLLTDEEEKSQSRLEQAKIEAKNSKKMVYEEVVKRWKEEDNAVEAKCKVKAMQSLCVKEMSQRKELEELLAKEKQEIQRTKNQHDKTVKELQTVQGQNSALEGQLAESHSVVKELEEKIISAVELLISFKQKRDQLRIECGNAQRRVRDIKKSIKREALSFFQPGLLEFSFSELNEATNNFEPSWKIGEGRYGNVYRGLLRHLHVAIKMFPSYGPQSHLKFQNEVEVLSRVRHPNLVTLIGTCPESRSLVFEYLRNGSLEDCLACKNKKSPLRWQTRMQIASDVCSALIYLHSNEPCIIHGNLKPSKVLIDANFGSKLSDFGFFHLIPQGESTGNSALCNESNNDSASVYIDPEYLETGKLTPESDVYSFGIILLRLLTGRPVLRIKKDVKCALEKRNFNSVLDSSAGDWPVAEAEQLAHLALRCCENNRLNRPDLVSEIWSVLEALRVSCVFPVSCSGSKEHRRIPSHFVCPILQEVMKDPQIAADGFTYEGEAIRGWLKSGHNTSPMTNLKLEHCNLLPNYALHQAIIEWQQRW